MKTENLISIEDQNSKIDELFKEQLGVEIDNADKHVIRLFAKWYAEKVIDKCAKEARLKVDIFDCYSGKLSESTIETSVTNTWNDVQEEVTVHEESILNVKNLL